MVLLGHLCDRSLGEVLECELTGGGNQDWRALAVAFVNRDPELSRLTLSQKTSMNLSHANDCQLFRRVVVFFSL